jgi:sugar phosphate isomerase/epimerase
VPAIFTIAATPEEYHASSRPSNFALSYDRLQMTAKSPYTPVLHSVSYAGAWSGHSALDVEAFLLKAVELGFPSIALVAKRPHVSPLDYNPEQRQRLRNRIAELGLNLAALMGYTDFTASIDRPGIPSAEMNAAYVGVVAKLASDLGTQRLRIFTAYSRNGVSYDAQYGELVKGLRLASREAAHHGVDLLLQNHHDIACHHQQLAWLLDEVNEPNLKCAFDAWAPHLQNVRGEDLAKAVETIGARLAFTTVADYQIQPRFRYDPDRVNYLSDEPPLVRAVPPGQGEIDYPSFFEGLRRIKYQGPVAYEMCAVLRGGGGLQNLDCAAGTFLEFLRSAGALAL